MQASKRWGAAMVMVALGFAGSALAAPKAPVPVGRRKVPLASASVSASASAPSVAASATASSVSGATAPSALGTASGAAAPISSIATSPLTPRPDEAPPVRAAASSKPSATYDEVMAEIAALRARVAAVGNAVWKSRITVRVRTSGSHGKFAGAKLMLDGAPVWSGNKGFVAEDWLGIFDGGVAPGLHALTFEVERRDDRDETYRTIERTTASVTVPNGKRLEVDVKLDDESSMGGDFPGDEAGRYDLRIRIQARAVTVK